MTFPITAVQDTPRPKDVGVLAMETYFPRRVCTNKSLLDGAIFDFLQ